VSLLERLGRSHLDDRAFARLWTSGGRHPHLESCATCQARYAEFDRWVLGIGEELRTEADRAMSSPERLAAQQAQIARRLEGLERPARVIAFPKAARAVISGNSHVRRWVTAAAAAGLIAGIGLGQILDLRHSFDPRRTAPETVTHVGNVAGGRTEIRKIAVSARDDEFLSDAEAFARPRVAALVPLEDLTPHARDLMERPR
jgi:hypothetical protein